jgi:hypothetical protein
MLAIEPLFNRVLLAPVYQGGASIYRLTPCSAAVAWERQPTMSHQLPAAIFATVPPAALPAIEPYRSIEPAERKYRPAPQYSDDPGDEDDGPF